MKKLSKKKVKERRKIGITKAYVSRANAIRKLQIPLADFRRLCILKGIYPVEPKNKSKLTGANTRRKTYFYTRDIQYLINDPLLYEFANFKVLMKRLTKAKGRHDLEKFNKVNENKPIYKLDGIVKERYPRFIDALRDCDDALSMCFLFAMFPKGRGRPDELIDQCRKLTLEFMHYVIASKSLRKVFITIKGYYYQAEIMGQAITWIVPHQFVIDRVSNVDLNVMKTFTEFYVTLLGFINYRLFKSINAMYPPEFVAVDILNVSHKGSRKRKHMDSGDYDDEEEDEAMLKDEMASSLVRQIRILENKSLAEAEKVDQQLDDIEDNKEDEVTLQQVITFERLFSGLKFFLNREVPRESLTFVIRSLGGEVTWDDEDDSSIKYHIVDRDTMAERRLDRTYIQPQWIYDSINARTLLPTEDYTMGAKLPPHLSPFVGDSQSGYRSKMHQLRQQFDEEGKGEPESEGETDTEAEVKPEAPKKIKKGRMAVRKGHLKISNKEEDAKKEAAETRRLGIMMIPKKKKRLFDRIERTNKERGKKEKKMNKKREIVEAIKKRRH